MTKIIQVALPDDLAEAVDAAVSSGEFASAPDPILHIVENWHVDRMVNEIGVEELRRLCEEGIASGPGQRMSTEEIIAEARRRVSPG